MRASNRNRGRQTVGLGEKRVRRRGALEGCLEPGDHAALLVEVGQRDVDLEESLWVDSLPAETEPASTSGERDVEIRPATKDREVSWQGPISIDVESRKL